MRHAVPVISPVIELHRVVTSSEIPPLIRGNSAKTIAAPTARSLRYRGAMMPLQPLGHFDGRAVGTRCPQRVNGTCRRADPRHSSRRDLPRHRPVFLRHGPTNHSQHHDHQQGDFRAHLQPLERAVKRRSQRCRSPLAERDLRQADEKDLPVRRTDGAAVAFHAILSHARRTIPREHHRSSCPDSPRQTLPDVTIPTPAIRSFRSRNLGKPPLTPPHIESN